MDRKTIIEILKGTGYEVYNLGQNYRMSSIPYLVLQDGGRIASTTMTRSRGYHRVYTVMCYSPDSSTILLDEVVDNVYKTLYNASERIEIDEGTFMPEFHDEDINMYMKSFDFQIPEARECCR